VETSAAGRMQPGATGSTKSSVLGSWELSAPAGFSTVRPDWRLSGSAPQSRLDEHFVCPRASCVEARIPRACSG